MEDILKQSCWKNMKTFENHYEKEKFIMQT